MIADIPRRARWTSITGRAVGVLGLIRAHVANVRGCCTRMISVRDVVHLPDLCAVMLIDGIWRGTDTINYRRRRIWWQPDDGI